MRILVVDVAAEHGGALSILKEFVSRFKKDTDNEYIVCVSNLDFEDSENVKFVKLPWVKRSRAHRIYFDFFYIKKLVRKYAPDKLFSLQNKGFSVKKVPQEVYFHNALFICEKRFKLKESKSLWIYQNIISKITKKSLKHADKIVVQANWIKHALSNQWGIDENKIFVDRPTINPIFLTEPILIQSEEKNLFYPANFNPYKNHKTLLAACLKVWEEKGETSFNLLLTGTKEKAPLYLKELSEAHKIVFLGNLSAEEMKEVYCRSTLVFPSYIETVGLPLAEARALSRPILAAKCKYTEEVIGDYDRVDFFAPFDVERLKLLVDKYMK